MPSGRIITICGSVTERRSFLAFSSTFHALVLFIPYQLWYNISIFVVKEFFVVAKNNSNSNKKSGGAGFIITLLILSSITGFSFTGIVAGVLLGLGIGKITSIMGSGLDTTTHNRRDREREAQEAERAKREQEAMLVRQRAEAERRKQEEASAIPLTGDKAADQVILTGQQMLATIRKENEAIPDQELSELMDHLSIKCEQIFRTVSESPAKAPQVRKFMNYYLPTTLKMLANYRTMQQRGVSYGEMQDARQTTVRGMNLVLTACQKQIDNMHRDNMLDISTDIDVLEQMLKRDGFTDNEIVESARTAAEAQARATSVPMIQFPVGEESDSTPQSTARRQDS